MSRANVIKLLGDNRSDAPYLGRFGPVAGASLGGGSWPLPLQHLQHFDLSLVAQSQSADPAHTRFTVTFTRSVTMRAFFLGNTNLSLDAEIRLIGWDDTARSVMAFDVRFPVYPPIAFTKDLDWRADNWWSGKPLAVDLEGFTQNAFHVFDSSVYASMIDVEIIDPLNPSGFVQLGRLLCQDGWVPSQNYSRGGSLQLESGTTVERTMSGAEIHDVQEPARVYNIGFNYLPEQEALDKGFELARRAAIQRSGGEVLVIDDSSPLNLHRLSFLAWVRPMVAWERPSSLFGNVAYQFKERLP